MASGGLVVVVLQYSRLLELSLSRDRLSGILPCLLLSLAYGSSPEMLIVDLTYLVDIITGALRRQRLAGPTDLATRRLRYRWKAEIMLFPLTHWVP